jgi:thioredoxin-like negative regulator of GroEL
MQHITDLETLEAMKFKDAIFILFGASHCNVCQSLRPRLTSLIKQHFPRMQTVYIDCGAHPDICAQHSVFSLPAVKVYVDGMLVLEDARAFSLNDLLERLKRPYAMWSGQRQ